MGAAMSRWASSPSGRLASRFAAVAVVLGTLGAGGCGPSDGTPASRRRPDAPAPTRPAGSHVFPAAAAPVLDDPSRDAWQRPDDVVAALGIARGQRLADVGCGTGYFTTRLLRATGETGHVLAVDVQQEMLDLLARRLEPADRAHVTLRRNPPDRPLEPTDAVDLVFCANTLYEVSDAMLARFVQSMADGLAPGGRLVVLDWKPEPMRPGPPLAIRLSAARIRELTERAGLAFTQDVALLPTHLLLVFTKPTPAPAK